MSKVLILPTHDQRVGTPYEFAHQTTEALAAERGVEVVGPDAGTATELVILRPIHPEELEQTLAANPNIGWVQFPFAGVEPFIPVARRHPHITFTSAKGSYAPPVAEHALTLALALLRDIPGRVRATSWGSTFGRTLNGANVVIIGGGGIGTELVRLFATWDTHRTVVRRQDVPVEGAQRTVTTDQLDTVLPEADVVVLAAAATEQTHQMIGAAELAIMKADAVLVNIGRGTLIDTEALVDTLRDRPEFSAGLDVTDPEPLPDGHPLWELPNALITPHTADTPEMCIPLLDQRIVANLDQRITDAGQTDNLEGLVDLDAGY